MTEPAWSVRRLAEAWDCTPSAIYDMVKAGRLATFTIGLRGIRITDEEKRRCESSNPKPIATEDVPSVSGAPIGLPTSQMKAVAAHASNSQLLMERHLKKHSTVLQKCDER